MRIAIAGTLIILLAGSLAVGDASSLRLISRPATEVPSAYALSQNYPNPFNPSTEIAFDIPAPTKVKLIVSDLTGREIVRLRNESLSAGTYTVQWNGQGRNGQPVSSGIYTYTLLAGDYSCTRKMMLLR